MTQDCVLTGNSDTGGCGRRLHMGGVAAPGPCPEEPVSGRDVGEL